MNKPQDFTPQQISKLLDSFKELKIWMDSVEEYALQQAIDGNPTPGYRLGSTRTTRIWLNEDEVVSNLLGANMELDTIAPREVLSVAKMEKLLKKQFANIADLVGTKPGNPKLIKESDTDF